jgi:hypothetical protein
MNDTHAIIDAFADNEPVDPGRLKDALAAPEGRDYLVDLLVLRGFVGGGASAGVMPVAGPAPGVSRTRWLSVAAAAVVISLAGGYYAGQQVAAVARGNQIDSAIDTSAPQPTRVIKLEDSADWIDRVGGE